MTEYAYTYDFVSLDDVVAGDYVSILSRETENKYLSPTPVSGRAQNRSIFVDAQGRRWNFRSDKVDFLGAFRAHATPVLPTAPGLYEITTLGGIGPRTDIYRAQRHEGTGKVSFYRIHSDGSTNEFRTDFNVLKVFQVVDIRIFQD